MGNAFFFPTGGRERAGGARACSAGRGNGARQGQARQGKGEAARSFAASASVRDEHLFCLFLEGEPIPAARNRDGRMGDARADAYTGIVCEANGNDQRSTTNERREDAAADREAEA